MTLIQPSLNAIIPEELLRQVEAVRNQVTLGEAELKRIEGIVKSLKTEINQLVKDKAYLEEQKTKVSSELEAIKKEITTRQSENEALVEKNNEITKIISMASQDIEHKSNEIVSDLKKLSLEREELDKDKQAFALQKQKFTEDKRIFDEKVAKLAEAIK